MGPHKNQSQLDIFLRFMEQHSDLAKGFVHGDKVYFEQLWMELADELNASGPPTKTVQAWKKVWIDMKLKVKQRLGHNRIETTKTGGGRFNKYILSPYDEQIAAICGLYVSVNGVEGAKNYGIPVKKGKSPATTIKADVIVEAASAPNPTSSILTPRNAEPTVTSPTVSINEYLIQQDVSTPVSQGNNVSMTQKENLFSKSPVTTPSKAYNRKRKSKASDVADVIEMEAEQFARISANIIKLQEEMKENNNSIKEISRNLREIKRLKEKELQETKRHNYEMEKSLKTKNEIKLQFLELKRLKLGL